MIAPKRKKPYWIVGIDEVGRGPIAGPVYVCAAALPVSLYRKMKWKGLRDSKQLTAASREKWYSEAARLEEAGTLRVGISYRSAENIDQCGISRSIRSCIGSALRQLDLKAEDCLVLLDGGLKAPSIYKEQKTIIKGDDSQKIISLASVIAKVTRDAVMRKMHKTYDRYGFYENKGYGTLAHRRALKAHGPSVVHRKTFITKILDKYS
jgi:ribonuclease HII